MRRELGQSNLDSAWAEGLISAEHQTQQQQPLSKTEEHEHERFNEEATARVPSPGQHIPDAREAEQREAHERDLTELGHGEVTCHDERYREHDPQQE